MKKAVFLFLAAFALGGCKDKKEGPIKIGVAGPHTGDLAAYGIGPLRAAEMIAEEVNASGGLGGRQVQLFKEDDLCKPEIGVNVAAKLVGKEVAVVMGHLCSGVVKATLGPYQDAQIISISPGATSPELTQSGQHPNFFRTIAPDDAQAQLQVELAVGTLGLRKLALLHDKADYGKGLAEYAKAFVEEDGRAEVVLFEGITPGGLDYSVIISKILGAGADGVIFGGYAPEGSKLVAQLRAKDEDLAFISGDGLKSSSLIQLAGDAAEGVYATGPRDVSNSEQAMKAKTAYEKKYGEAPGTFFLEGYSAMLAALNAIEKAGSTDYEAIMKALREEEVDTPVGKMRFNELGDAIGVGFSVYQVREGAFVEIQ